MINQVAQAAAVVVCIALALIWIARRARRKGDAPCDEGCAGCPLADQCRKPGKGTGDKESAQER